MNEQAKGLAAAVRGFTQDPHRATYEACVTALDQWDIAERKVQERRDWQALTNDYLRFSRMFGWTQAKMLVQDFGVLSLKGTQPSQWPAIREALAQSPATLAARREARKPQQAVSAELRAKHAPELAEALRALLARSDRLRAAVTLDRYDDAVKAEREANTQRNKPIEGTASDARVSEARIAENRKQNAKAFEKICSTRPLTEGEKIAWRGGYVHKLVDAQQNKPVGGSHLAAMAPAKGCNCVTCRDERRRGLNLNDSNY